MELRRCWLLGVEPNRPLLLGVEFLSLGVDSVIIAGLAIFVVDGVLVFTKLARELSTDERLVFEDGLLSPLATNDPPQARQSTIWTNTMSYNHVIDY